MPFIGQTPGRSPVKNQPEGGNTPIQGVFPQWRYVMAITANHSKRFISLFNETARYHHRQRVFRDFITLAAASIHNGICFDEKLEQEYREAIGHYETNNAKRMAQLLSEVVMGLEIEGGDFLGSLFMQLELGEAGRGQFFTPMSVSRMMAEMQMADINKILANKPFITVSEPACGSAGMMLAIAEVMKEKGFTCQASLGVLYGYRFSGSGNGLYPVFADGHRRRVSTGNLLTNEQMRVMYTPLH
jgi:hypothetical protein